MEFDNVIKSRRSIRKFKSDPIPDEYVKEMLEAARLAPSGLNLQPWRYVVVKDKFIKESIIGTTPSPFASGAPVIILCCIDMTAFNAAGARIMELYEAGALSNTVVEQYTSGSFIKKENVKELMIRANLSFNAAISIDHLILKATDLGLGSCWLGIFDQNQIKKLVGLEDKYEIISLVAVGYSDQSPSPRPRFSMEQILLREV